MDKPDYHTDKNLDNKNRFVKNLEKLSNSEIALYLRSKSEQLLGIMRLIEVKNILNYKDFRSVIGWCRKNKVCIFHQGNTQFVNKWEFILAFYKPFIKHLRKTQENWVVLFVSYVKGDITNLIGETFEDAPLEISKPYKPKSKSEASFFQKIKKL